MVQADRTLPSEGRDRRFESCWEHDAHLAGAGGGPQPRRCRVRSPGASLWPVAQCAGPTVVLTLWHQPISTARTGEPGAAAGTAVVLVLMAPSLVPVVARWVRTFPVPGASGPSPDPLWWTVLAVCAAAIAILAGGRDLPRWRSRVP